MKPYVPLLFLFAATSLTADAQRMRTDPIQFVPRTSVAVGYSFLDGNAPPGQTDRFYANGGFASVNVAPNHWFSIAAELQGLRSSNISDIGQNLTLLTYTAGPRITFRQARTTEFVQATFGAAHGSDSYFPSGSTYTSSATSFALTAGGGLDIELSHTFALRAIEAQYLHTALPNGVNGSQNQLLIGAGLVVKFGGHYASPSSHASVEHAQKKVSINCSANLRTLRRGEVLEVTAITHSEPGDDVELVWSTNAGTLARNDNAVSLDTSALVPGRYHITAHAALISEGSVTAVCEVPFRVVEDSKEPAPISSSPPPTKPNDTDLEFHEHVRDVYFDYDKWALRPDAGPSIAETAAYLQAHPQLRVLIGGYSDERGSTTYNINLGLKRAETVREALLAAGISQERIRVVSYGKGVQVCVDPKEACYQRNRRAAFLIQP